MYRVLCNEKRTSISRDNSGKVWGNPGRYVSGEFYGNNQRFPKVTVNRKKDFSASISSMSFGPSYSWTLDLHLCIYMVQCKFDSYYPHQMYAYLCKYTLYVPANVVFYYSILLYDNK